MSGYNKDPRDIILKPVVSEKSYGLIDSGVYTFIVSPGANKTEIRQAVEAIFDVKVKSVNTLIREGKFKTFKNKIGQQSDVKRAIVTLEEGHRIDVTTGL